MFVLYKLFSAELLHTQSALRKTHHCSITNMGQHLDAPCRNESFLPPSLSLSALVLARVHAGIAFFFVSPHSTGICIHQPSPTKCSHPPLFWCAPKFISSSQQPQSGHFERVKCKRKFTWNNMPRSWHLKWTKSGRAPDLLQLPWERFFKSHCCASASAALHSLKSPHHLQWILPKAHSPRLKIDMRLEVSDKGRHKIVAARDIKGQSWNILQVQADLGSSFSATCHQHTPHFPLNITDEKYTWAAVSMGQGPAQSWDCAAAVTPLQQPRGGSARASVRTSGTRRGTSAPFPRVEGLVALMQCSVFSKQQHLLSQRPDRFVYIQAISQSEKGLKSFFQTFNGLIN